jgi:tetratricopeptide (TPR) repeat protein
MGIEYLPHAMAIAKEVGDRAGEARAYANLGNAYHSKGDYSKAIEYLAQDLAIAKEVGSRAVEGGAYGNLRDAYQSKEDYSKALEYHEHHLAIAKEVVDRAGKGAALRIPWHLPHALERVRQSRRLLQSTKHLPQSTTCLGNVA